MEFQKHYGIAVTNADAEEGAKIIMSTEVMEAIARGCGRIMMSAREEHIKTDTKTGFRDVVTEYDRRIQKYAVTELSAAYPSAHFVCEEGDASDPESNGLVFIIDPIDGTANFTHHYGHSCVSIGCTLDGEVVAGVIYDPFKGEMFTAKKGKGAYLNGEAIHVTDRNLAESLVLFGTSPYNPHLADETIEKVRSLYGRCQDIRRTGSAALDLCYVAAGRAGVYFELELSVWDYAAGALIAEEAGAEVIRTDGGKLDFTGATKNPVLAGRRDLIEESGLIRESGAQN